MEWFAAIFFILLAIAAPYFTLIGGILGLLALGAFFPEVTEDDALSLLLVFEAAVLLWVITKLVMTFVVSHKHGRQTRRYRYAQKNMQYAIPEETRDAYAVLGLEPTCSPGELHRAWREAVKECHPDLVSRQGAAGLTDATERLSQINVAYEICRKQFRLRKTA